MSDTFSHVTEIPGQSATEEQLSMILTRYSFAESYCSNKKVLEIACGSGTGLDMISKNAEIVVAGDIDNDLIKIAKQSTKNNDKIEVCLLDAMNLPFEDNSFDVIIIFEAIYYLTDVKLFLKGVNRILNKGGYLLISTVNCNWHGFNRSPGAVNYLDIEGLDEMLKSQNYVCTFKIGFYDESKGINFLISRIRKIAVRLKMIPRTMRGKAILKRFFYGRLRPIPKFITHNDARLYSLVNFNGSLEITNYKQLYVIAKNIKSE